ncbi:DUF943 family protein [Pantoea sp. BAV 3049]|uniref:DUF943 family protein n=1 Tax=Pantoea sp. BAV 3049 TaxID=2654188 RepID=UPI00131DEF2F|nr:DUF943 family protein [Pantoea sp. BAV 3049]
MAGKGIKIIIALYLLGGCLVGYTLWSSLRPVEIVAIHNRSSGFSDVLVRNFPFTDKGKINWWLKNKDTLKDKYNIPAPESDGSFNITFWLFGEGYMEEGKHDRLCFDEMKSKENCIEKDAAFSVSNSINLGTFFTVYDGKYQLKKNGSIVKLDNKLEAK